MVNTYVVRHGYLWYVNTREQFVDDVFDLRCGDSVERSSTPLAKRKKDISDLGCNGYPEASWLDRCRVTGSGQITRRLTTPT